MKTLLTWLVLAFADGPQVDVATLNGQQKTGELVSVDAKEWKLRVNGREESIAASDILTATWPPATAKLEAAPFELKLIDGSKLAVTQATLEGDWLTVESASLGKQKLARTTIASLRLGAPAGPIEQSWADLSQRDKKQDMLVIRKNDVLDFVEGVVGKITATDVQVLLDGEPVTVKREKVFGVVVYQRATSNQKPVGSLELMNGDKLFARSVVLTNGQFQVTLPTGGEASVPLIQVRRVDFSLGKLTWLGDLKPRDMKHDFILMDGLPEYGVDRSLLGERLRVGDKFFDRGVWIHSKTRLKYRLEGDYSRFQAWMGIQSSHTGNVHVEFLADGQKLLAADVMAGAKAPQRVDLDLKGKFVLEVVVDYGDDGDDIGDHLTLGDARLTK
jgi:hypothetical protein